MTETKKLDIHPKPKQPVQINRRLVLGLAVVITTIVLYAIIAALTSTGRYSSKTQEAIIASSVAGANFKGISTELKELPGSYKDVDGIKRYIRDSSATEVAMLAQQLNELQDAYSMLKHQLATRVDTPAVVEKKVDLPPYEVRTAPLMFNNLGSDATNLLGPFGNKLPGQPMDGKDKDADLIATPQQQEYFRKKADNELKLAVAKGKDDPQAIYDMHNVVKPMYPGQQVMASTIIPASLVTGVSTAGKGTIVAQVRSNIYDSTYGKNLLIPKGSKLIGRYDSNPRYGQRRLLLAFDRLIRPDTSSILLGEPWGADAIGQGGIEGNVDNHWAKIIGASTISVILSVGAGMGSDRFMKDNSNNVSASGRGFMNTANAINDIGQQMVGKAMGIPPTITLPPGHQFNVVVRKDMILPPVKRK